MLSMNARRRALLFPHLARIPDLSVGELHEPACCRDHEQRDRDPGKQQLPPVFVGMVKHLVLGCTDYNDQRIVAHGPVGDEPAHAIE